MEYLSAGLSEFLGLGIDESQEIARYCQLTMKNPEKIRRYLSDLLPQTDSVNVFINNVVRNLRVETTDSSKSNNKSNNNNKFNPKSNAKAMPKANSGKLVVLPGGKSKQTKQQDYSQPIGRDSSKLITGNENVRLSVMNCLVCGMIYETKEFEKLSLCSFCNTPLSRKGRKGTTEAEKAAFSKAEAQKNKLISFDASAAERTKVLDDQSDYYQSTISSKWATDFEKQNAKDEQAKAESLLSDFRRKVHISLDISNRKLVESTAPKLPEQAGAIYEALKRMS